MKSTSAISKASFADVCTLESLFRHKYIFSLVLGIGIIATAVVLFGRSRSFESTARVFIRLGRESVPDSTTAVTGLAPQSTDPQKREIQSAIDLIRSNAMMEGIVEHIGVDSVLHYSDKFTASNTSNSPIDLLKAQIPRVKRFLASYRLADPENPRASAISKLEKQIKAATEEHSNIISIRVRSDSPKLSQEIGTTMLELFKDLHRKAHMAPGARSFFSEQLDSVKHQLDDLMCKLRDVKNEAGISSIEDQKEVLTERLKNIENAISIAESDQKGTAARISAMQSSLDQIPERVLASEVDGLTNTSKDDMRSTLYRLELEYAELRSRLTEDNPSVLRKKRQLEEAREVLGTEQVDSQKTTSVSVTHQEVQVRHLIAKAEGASASARVTELQKQRDETLKEIRENNRRELDIETLSREIAVLKEKYQKYAESLEQARIDEALQHDNMSSINIVQPPNYNDDPIDTSNSMVALIGLVGSIFTALGAAFGRRYLRNELTSPDDVERELELPVLGIIPVSQHRRIQTS
jgi:polysaccharide biosynthesis protein PslE